MRPGLYQRLGTAQDIVETVRSHSRDMAVIEDAGSKVETAYFIKMDDINWSGNVVIQKLLHIQLSLVFGKGRLMLGGLS